MTNRPRTENSITPADDPRVLDPILDALDIRPPTREIARELASTIEETMWVVGKRRTTVAATAVYVASQATEEPITQSDVASATEVTSGAISQHKTALLNGASSLDL